jgi:4-hydroxybenzoate polyprenyltransferase
MSNTNLSQANTNKSSLPLYVDLDGTLTLADVTFESIVAYIKKNPLNVFLILFWLLKGRSFCKRQVAHRVQMDTSSLPLEKHFWEYLKEEHAKGRKLILASASDEILVKPIANRLEIFCDVIAGQGQENISGKNKLNKIKEHVGDAEFAYAGNSNVDFEVWVGANEQIVVSNSRHFISRVKTRFPEAHDFFSAKNYPSYLSILRPHQWVKNVLVFAPLILAHRIFELSLILVSIQAFIAFSLCASAVYTVNDLFDIEADRLHKRKRARPFASGEVQVKFGLLLAPALFFISFILALQINHAFFICLAIYFAVTFAYSSKLKQVAIIDIIILALLYTLRIIAGGAATVVPVSQWLMSFSLFLFLSLACIKRFSELYFQSDNGEKLPGRGYSKSDLNAIAAFGISSAYISMLVLVFYVNSKEVTALYLKQEVLWLLCPVLLYWISRMWLKTWRGEVHDDPIVYALKDPTSYCVVMIIGLLLLFAI